MARSCGGRHQDRAATRTSQVTRSDISVADNYIRTKKNFKQ